MTRMIVACDEFGPLNNRGDRPRTLEESPCNNHNAGIVRIIQVLIETTNPVWPGYC